MKKNAMLKNVDLVFRDDGIPAIRIIMEDDLAVYICTSTRSIRKVFDELVDFTGIKCLSEMRNIPIRYEMTSECVYHSTTYNLTLYDYLDDSKSVRIY